jgi:pimeloyl-ACP methyl ester carboxylesterase
MKHFKICLIYCLACCISMPPASHASSGLLRALKDSTGYFRSFDGEKIYFELHGKGQPVLLVHGFTGTGDSWKKTVLYQGLLDKSYMVITVDLRGNGHSAKPHQDTSYAHDAEAKDLMGLISLLGIEAYEVVGYSRGSIITARLLVLDHRVVKAVMGGIGLDFSDPEWPRRIMFYKALSGDSVPELAPMVKRIQAEGLDQQSLALQQKEQPSTSKTDLGRIRQPVLVICGTEDADNGSASALARIIPNAVLKKVPGDHGSTIRSVPFSSEVIEFLAK